MSLTHRRWWLILSIWMLALAPIASKEAEVAAGLKAEIEHFSLLASHDPKNVSLQYTVGMLYQLAGQPQQVCDYLYNAYNLDPVHVNPELLFHLANNLKAIGENEAAVNFYSLAIGLVPNHAVNWVLIAISLDFIGHPEEAVRGFQTVLRMGPTPRIISWVDIYMLSALSKVGTWKRALHRYQDLVGALSPMPAGHQSLPVPPSGWVLDHAKKRVIQLSLSDRSLHTEESFLAAAARHRALWTEHGDRWRADQDSAWIRDQLQSRQNPAVGCENARALIVELGRRDGKTGRIGSEIHGFGLGAQMHVLSVALSYAFRTNRVLLMRQQDNWWYTDVRDCPSRSFDCYFQPMSRCTEDEIMGSLKAREKVEMLSKKTEHQRVVYTDCRLDNYLNKKENRIFVPEELRHRGLLWWRSELMQYIMRPNPVMSGLVRSEMDRLGWRSDMTITGIHVRHGDKKTESSVIPMAHYLDAAVQIATGRNGPQHGPTMLYISTDDELALDEARLWVQEARTSYGNIQIMAREGEVRGVSTATDKVVDMHNVNATRYGEEAIVNLLLLSHCNNFIGTFSSNFGRLAFELAFSRQAGDIVAASMDVFWHAYP